MLDRFYYWIAQYSVDKICVFNFVNFTVANEFQKDIQRVPDTRADRFEFGQKQSPCMHIRSTCKCAYRTHTRSCKWTRAKRFLAKYTLYDIISITTCCIQILRYLTPTITIMTQGDELVRLYFMYIHTRNMYVYVHIIILYAFYTIVCHRMLFMWSFYERYNIIIILLHYQVAKGLVIDACTTIVYCKYNNVLTISGWNRLTFHR